MELVRTLKVTHEAGFHARPSTAFVQLAQGFRSEVTIGRPEGEEADGKSVIAVLTLGLQQHEKIFLRVRGSDAEQAMEALVGLIRSNFQGE
ncbi:MAG: HPr family phosphocarrier protein [Planctomycetota bacterium]